MVKLYELSEVYNKIRQEIEEEPEKEEKWSQSLSDIEEDFSEKSINIAKIIKCWEADEKAYQEQILYLERKKKALSNKISWMKRYIQTNMEHIGVDVISTTDAQGLIIRLQNSPFSIVVEDEHIIPPSWINVKVEMPLSKLPAECYEYQKSLDVDKASLLKLFKEGGQLPLGVSAVQKKHLRIY